MPQGMPKGMRTTMGWVLGIAIIAFILLIMVVIFGNLLGNVGLARESSAFVNETITLNVSAVPASANDTRWVNPVLSGILMTNATGGEVLASDNYTTSTNVISATTGVYNGTEVNVSYTVNYDSQAKVDADSIILNYTSSASNTSAQFPTVGTIIGVAILLLILIGLLIFAIRKMMGITGAASFGGSSRSSKFSGSSRGFG